MRNISFDNPYWLLLAIPLLLALFIPYFVSVSRDNRNKGWIASLVIHCLIAVCVTLAAAGLVHTTVMTRTKVYIVADLSYSTNRNLDEIDAHIANIAEELPPNSRLGIVCFGNDSKILTSSGTEIKSVKEATVDTSGTNIVGALDYTATLFSENELKRIILLTDGMDTASANADLVSAVERLKARNIRLDAVYLDSNLEDGVHEVQISGAEYTHSTYLNYDTQVQIQIESNTDNDAMLDLFMKNADGEYVKINTTVLHLDAGINVATFDLLTDTEGVFDYKAVVSATSDGSEQNNAYTFTQTVAGKRNVLLVTEKQSDVNELTALYRETAELDPYVINNFNRDVPYTVEALSAYDEIILSNVDVRKINNIYAFVDSVDAVVSEYGKSLITLGDLQMQNKDDPIFERLEELLPVNFGNANKDAKLYTIVLDISRSMNDTSQLIIAKDAALKLLSLLNDEDCVAYVTLAGEARIEQIPTPLGECREELYEKIQTATPSQGTFIGEALKMAYDHIKDLDYAEKQVMLISDGLTFTYEPEDAAKIASDMKADGITVSAVNILSGNEPQAVKLLSAIASNGGGNYYLIERAEAVADLIFATIANELTESIVEKESKVTINTFRDDTVNGILSLPNVFGYVNSKAKPDANMVLSVDYQKNADTVTQVPLYSYRDHGNGRVASFTSSLSGDWLKGWNTDTKTNFFGNVLTSNTPPERIHYPYNLNFTYEGNYSTLEIVPSYLNPLAKATVVVTDPSGAEYKETLAFDLNRYLTTFETPKTGRYHIQITYAYGTHRFVSEVYYNVAYQPEYDAFAVYDVSNLHDFMRGSGEISTDGKLDLTNDRNDVSTYELNFRMPLLITAVVLVLVDIFIRKTRWADIKRWFQKKKGGKKV
ncbi:MAG: VWA domain-containing protein [Clostridia bacterium]|nr:VWA domain-containing protein [Clostridia bacterium]